MWIKIKLNSYLIPLYIKYKQDGFIFDYVQNKIINTNKNFSISLPFKLLKKKNLYDFELIFNKKEVYINFCINVESLTFYIKNKKIIPEKNNIFKILKSINNKKNIKFRLLNNLNRFVSKFEIFKYISNEYMIIKNIIFNLKTEEIDIYNSSIIKSFTPSFYFYFTYNFFNNIDLVNSNKICIIDDSFKYSNNNNVINSTNYKFFTKKSFFNKNILIIDKSFFLSKKYTKNYKKFHTSYNSKYSYENYKKYIKNSSSASPIGKDGWNSNDFFFNIELLDNFNFVLNNINPLEIINHPLIYSQNRIFFIFNSINSSLISKCTQFINLHNKKNNINISPSTYHEKVFMLDSFKYSFYQSMKNIKTLNVLKLETRYNEIPYSFSIFKKKEITNCYINYKEIGYDTYVELNCNHKFIAENFNLYLKNNNVCPICRKTINHQKICIHENSLINNLFGDKFKKIYDQNKNIHHIIIGKNINPILKNFALKNINNLSILPYYDLNFHLKFNKNSNIYFYNIEDNYLMINYAKDKTILFINSIFKLSNNNIIANE